MTAEKFIAFIGKLLEKTKSGEIKWIRCSLNPYDEIWASSTKSFSCVAGTMKVDMLSDEDSDSMRFYIEYDRRLPVTTWIPESDEERQISLRLVNYVYNLFPNLEKSIDDFLNNF